MNSSVLVDTNVLIYAIDADSQFHHRALTLLSDTTVRFFVTSKNISEFLVVLTRDDDINISTVKCLEILNDLLADMEILYPNSMTIKVFYELVRKYNPRGLWIHDIEIASISIAHGISKIATMNISDFERIDEIEILPI